MVYIGGDGVTVAAVAVGQAYHNILVWIASAIGATSLSLRQSHTPGDRIEIVKGNSMVDPSIFSTPLVSFGSLHPSLFFTISTLFSTIRSNIILH